jgi:hypothetical protein
MKHSLKVIFLISSVQSTGHVRTLFIHPKGRRKHVLHYRQLIKTARFLTWRKGAEGDVVHGFVVPRKVDVERGQVPQSAGLHAKLDADYIALGQFSFHRRLQVEHGSAEKHDFLPAVRVEAPIICYLHEPNNPPLVHGGGAAEEFGPECS